MNICWNLPVGIDESLKFFRIYVRVVFGTHRLLLNIVEILKLCPNPMSARSLSKQEIEIDLL